MYPKLIITNDCVAYLHRLSASGVKVFNLDYDLDEDVTSMQNFKSDKVIAVGDVAKSNKLIQKFLRFVEGSQFNLICVASRDCFDGVFLSRFMEVEKHILPIPNSDNSFEALSKIISDEGSVKDLLLKCPGFLPIFMMYNRSNLPVKRKLFS